MKPHPPSAVSTHCAVVVHVETRGPAVRSEIKCVVSVFFVSKGQAGLKASSDWDETEVNFCNHPIGSLKIVREAEAEPESLWRNCSVRGLFLFDAGAHSAGLFVWVDDQLVSHPACPLLPPSVVGQRGNGTCMCTREWLHSGDKGVGGVVFYSGDGLTGQEGPLAPPPRKWSGSWTELL